MGSMHRRKASRTTEVIGATAAVVVVLPVASATVPVIQRIVRAGPGQIPVATITISTSTRRAM